MATAEGIPGKIDPPVILEVQSSRVEVSWKPPSKMNGILAHYIVHLSDGKAIKTLTLSLVVKGTSCYFLLVLKVLAVTCHW